MTNAEWKISRNGRKKAGSAIGWPVGRFWEGQQHLCGVCHTQRPPSPERQQRSLRAGLPARWTTQNLAARRTPTPLGVNNRRPTYTANPPKWSNVTDNPNLRQHHRGHLYSEAWPGQNKATPKQKDMVRLEPLGPYSAQIRLYTETVGQCRSSVRKSAKFVDLRQEKYIYRGKKLAYILNSAFGNKSGRNK